MSLRQEFRLAKLQLRHLDEDWATTFGSGACDCLTPTAFLCLRAAELAAMLAILGVSLYAAALEHMEQAPGGGLTGASCLKYWPIFLTNWSLVVAVLYLLAATYTTYLAQQLQAKAGAAPLCVQLTWLLQGLALPTAFFVTVLYWLLVFDGTVHTETVWVHGVNFLVVLIDVVASRQPICLLHAAYFLAYGSVYLLWTLLYYHAGGVDCHAHPYIYAALDWRYTESTLTLALEILFVAVPAVSLLFWAGLQGVRWCQGVRQPGALAPAPRAPRPAAEPGPGGLTRKIIAFDGRLRDALPRLLRRGQRKMRGSRSPRGASVKSIYEEAER